MRSICVFLLASFSLLACKHKQELPVNMSIDRHWQFKNINDTLWNSASIPGTVHTDLLKNKLIEDPFIGNHETNMQWISESDWEYKTHFKVQPEELEKTHHELIFKGLDTYASVYMNDLLILKTNNAFREYVVDVKGIIKAKNSLKIFFKNPAQIESKVASKLPYTLPEGNRVFTRKAQFQYGWDWGPKLNTSGIWRPITLKTWNSYTIKDIYIKQLYLGDEKASLELQLEQSTPHKTPLTYKIYIDDKLYKSIHQTPKNGLTKLAVEIKNPTRWWPHNLGEPYLYTIKVLVFKQKTLLDQVETKTGLRTVELATEKDAIGSAFYFKINGIAVYAKGANYIPQNSFQSEVTEKHYEQLLNDVVGANMNMLRVWGGGIYENDLFYELADEKGLLIWQDFMFACAMYPGDPEFLETVQQEAIQNVKRLRNHPAVVLWCGNNESAEGWSRWGWKKGRSKAEKNEIWSHYLKLFDSILPSTVQSYSDTPYWESSPLFGRGNKKYLTQGDAHDWWVWHDGYPFEHFESNIPRFMSEFGFQSFPSLETIKFINQSDTISFNSDAFKNHQKHAKGFSLIEDYMQRDYKIPSKPEDYVYVSQLLQARGIVKGIEAQRRSRPHCMGSLFWQLNDCWPAISWSSIDYFGHWKALHYKAKKAFENLFISVEIDLNNLSVFLINDHLTAQMDTLKLTLMDFDGRILWEESKHVTVDSNSSQKVFEMDLSTLKFDPKSSVLIAKFKKETKETYLVKPKDMQLKHAKIFRTLSKTMDGFKIELRSKVLQKDVFMQAKSKGHFSDNFFDLLPNKTKVIFFKSNSISIDDLSITTLNSIHY